MSPSFCRVFLCVAILGFVACKAHETSDSEATGATDAAGAEGGGMMAAPSASNRRRNFLV